MSRMDAVRKLLYGGLRQKDNAFDAATDPGLTVLERAYLPTHAHSWAKYYNPDPTSPTYVAAETPYINRLTPFAAPDVVTSPREMEAKTTLSHNVNVVADPACVTPAVGLTFPLATGVSGAARPCRNFKFTTALTFLNLGDQIVMEKRDDNTKRFTAVVLDMSPDKKDIVVRVDAAGIVGNGATDDWRIKNLSTTGISFCNLTQGSAAGDNHK